MSAGCKNFRKRNAILAYLQNTNAHPSAETIYADLKAEIPDLSMGTVYRNLARFKEQGLIASLGTVDGVERFDGNTAPHVHYICRQCGSVLDLQNLHIPEELNRAAAADAGGEVTGCQLTFTGRCSQCIRANTL